MNLSHRNTNKDYRQFVSDYHFKSILITILSEKSLKEHASGFLIDVQYGANIFADLIPMEKKLI